MPTPAYTTDQTVAPVTGNPPHPYPAADPCWYAILTKARHEKIVRDRLSRGDIEQFLPTMIRVNQWKDRRQRVEMPLFACYCFARFHWQDRFSVLNVPGVCQILGSRGIPEAIPQNEIDAIKAMTASKLPYQTHPYLTKGTCVEVVRGPMLGVKGLLLSHRRPYRLVISIKLLQQAASVEIDADDVVPLAQSLDRDSHTCPAAA